MKQLRPYQSEAINIVFSELAQGCNSQLMVLATGLGKTHVACQILNNPMFSKVLWLTHSEELISQSAMAILQNEFQVPDLRNHIEEKGGMIEYFNHLEKTDPDDLFDGWLPIDNEIYPFLGIIKQQRMDLHARVCVASVQTIVRRLGKIDPNMFDLIIADEAHMAMSNTWSQVINYFNKKLLLGLTATPKRTDGMSLGNLFDKIVIERDIKFGIDNKFLCEIDAIRVKTSSNLDSVRTTAGELNQKDLENIVNTPVRNNLIAEKFIELCAGRHALVFCVDVQHAIDLCEAFERYDIRSSFIVGDETLCPNRKERLQLFRDKELRALTNVNILTAGVDIPDTDCIIMARPTKSLVLFMQAIGRGTRLKSHGGNLLVLDIVDNSSKHQLVNTFTLDKEKRLEDRVFITQEKREALIVKRNAKLEAEIKKDERVDLLKLPVMREAFGDWMKKPASEKQLAWLERLGYDIVNNSYTMGQCNEIVSILPAYDWQLRKAKDAGYDVSHGMTAGVWSMIRPKIEAQKGTKQKSIINNL